jgi:hypothetical protein
MTSTTHDHSGVAGSEPPSDFGRHNMVAFGRQRLFLSHLPMFMAPHDAQLLLAASVGDALQPVWTAERDSHPDERFYTVMPERFELSSLYLPPGEPRRRSFQATFFRGHLERGGQPIPELTDIEVHVPQVLYARRFGTADRPADLTYQLVGGGGELFLAHTISRPPDFDQILSVRVAGQEPNEDELARGIDVVCVGRPNTAADRLRDGSVTARGHVTGAHRFLDLELTGLRELYFEEGELSTSRGAFEPTPLETEAGFGG